MNQGLSRGTGDVHVDGMDHALFAVVGLAAVYPFRVLVPDSEGEACPGRAVRRRRRDESGEEAAPEGLTWLREARLDY